MYTKQMSQLAQSVQTDSVDSGENIHYSIFDGSL